MCVAAAIAGAGIVGAGATIYSADKASNAQSNAAQQANATQQGMFDKTQANLNPYMNSGVAANNLLQSRLPELTTAIPLPPNMTQAQLEQTPGYQFNLSQGLQAVQNSVAARGLGGSSAALKDAAQYATGLADSTYQQQFQNYQQQFQNQLTNQGNAYNRLLGSAGLGENAAAGLGNNAVQTGANIGNNITSAGNAQGAAAIAAGNGISNAASSIPNGLLTQQYLKNQSNYNNLLAGNSSNTGNGYYGTSSTLVNPNYGDGSGSGFASGIQMY